MNFTLSVHIMHVRYVSDEWCPSSNIALNLGVLMGQAYESGKVTDAVDSEVG